MKVENHFYETIFYTTSAIVAWCIVKDEDWMPDYLGGKGHTINCLQDLPFVKYDRNLTTFAFVTFGFRIESLVSHVLLKERGNDFMELLFHDIVTILLFVGYLYGNMMAWGTMIVIIHDLTDGPIHLSKGMYAMIFKDSAVVPFLLAQLLWAYLRLYCFAKIIYELLQGEYPEGREFFRPFLYMSAGFLCCLYALHWLWFLMFQRINLAVITK